MERLTRYLLSNSNLAGCGAAAAVVALYLFGTIHNYWLALAVLGYGAGYSSMLRPAPKQLRNEASTTETLLWLRETALPKMPPEAARVLTNIIEVTEELMPRLKELEGQGMVQAQNRTMLKQTMSRFLPEVVNGYLKLPALYARNTKVEGGKTPNELLVEQLSLLHNHVLEIREGIYSADVNSLLTNGRFLQEKFSRTFRIGED